MREREKEEGKEVEFPPRGREKRESAGELQKGERREESARELEKGEKRREREILSFIFLYFL